MQMATWAARIGAVSYVLWGVFHLAVANKVYTLAEQSTGMARGRLQQDAFYLLFFAASGILIAVILNWRNDKQGHWMNSTLIAFADIPFVLFVLAPGLIPWWPGLVGPLLWLIAFVFTTVARFSADPRVAADAAA
jgi:Ca2+/Na+ antiporter